MKQENNNFGCRLIVGLTVFALAAFGCLGLVVGFGTGGAVVRANPPVTYTDNSREIDINITDNEINFFSKNSISDDDCYGQYSEIDCSRQNNGGWYLGD